MANLVVGLFCLLVLLIGFSGWTGAIIIRLMMIAADYSLHVTEKAAKLVSEEEWLKSEVRKDELRLRLAELRGSAHLGGQRSSCRPPANVSPDALLPL